MRSDAADNFDRWIRDGVVGDEIIAAYGDPADEPDFWRDRSRRTFFDRVTEPVLIRHGTADDTCPLEWSHATLDVLQSAGLEADLIEYESEPHALVAAWGTSISGPCHEPCHARADRVLVGGLGERTCWSDLVRHQGLEPRTR